MGSQGSGYLAEVCFNEQGQFRWEIAYVASGSDAAKIKTRVCVWRSDRWDPNLPRSAEWRLLSSQAAVPRHKTGRQQWASPSVLGRFEESRCPSWNGLFNVSLGCLQNGKASVFASTKWANAKCPCHPHPCVHWKDPFYSTQCESNIVHFKSYLLNSIPYTEAAPRRSPCQTLVSEVSLRTSSLWGRLSNWSIYTMLGWDMKLTLTHLDHHSTKPTHPKGTGTRAEIR